MKNHYSLVVGLVEAISRDIAATFPDLSRMCSIFLTKTLENLDTHGISYATIMLPSYGKWFESCLEAGHILPSRPPYHGKRTSSEIYPTFLYGLWANIFDEGGCVRQDACPTSVFFLRQVYYFAKKLNMECERTRTYETVESFERLENSLVRPWPNTWLSDVPVWESRTGHPLYGESSVDRHQRDLFADGVESSIPWARFRSLCRASVAAWGDINIWDLVPKHGPGAVSDSQYGNKYELAVWPKKLNSIFNSDWFASTNFEDNTISDEEPSSVMHEVPKTQKGPRLIAAEPTAHQWAQGSLLRWLEQAISTSPLGLSIDFRNQGYSGALALESSRTQEYATIDLSEASDRVTCRLVEYVFQSHLTLLDCLHACRTRSIRIPLALRKDRIETLIQLNKFSTMGSAVTFPVQTIVFTLIAHFAMMIDDEDWDVTNHGMRSRATSIRVFGDDIIIKAKYYETMSMLLRELGLKVNTEKSFYKGYFREACGVDAFMGYDVTPAYLRTPYDPRKPASLGSIIEASNNFHKKGLWFAADYLARTVPSNELELVMKGNEARWSLTLYTFCGHVTHDGNIRWNKALHRYERLSIQLTSKQKLKKGSGKASLLQYFVEDPTRAEIPHWESGQAMRPSIKKQRRWVTID